MTVARWCAIRLRPNQRPLARLGPAGVTLLGAGRTDRLKVMRLGRTFIHPAVDVLVIGGVLSIPVALLARGAGLRFDVVRMMPLVLLLSYAHVTASLLRLYSKEGVVRSRPFLSVGFPLLTVVATGVLLLSGTQVASRVQGIYLTWSAYHFAAQTFGLALMYAQRSGSAVSPKEKRFLQATCLATFVYAILGPAGGLTLVIPPSVYASPVMESMRQGLRAVLLVALLGAPLLLAAHKRRRGEALPLMSLILMYTNAAWWVLFVPTDAFVWASLSHGLQYLAIAMVFHVKDAQKAPEDRHGRAYHAVTFYVASVALAFGLYYGGPLLFAAISQDFNHSATTLQVALMLNLHHVILDGFIWRRVPGEAGKGLGVPALAARA